MGVKLRDDVVWRESEGAVIVLDTRSSLYLTIGGTGSLLWPLLVAGTTVPALARQLVETFDIGEDAALSDVASFVDSLREHDLVTG